MPICKNNPKKYYTGEEPSPKGLGFCASGEAEGTQMTGRDGNVWIKSAGKWVKHQTKPNVDDLYELFTKKLWKWWQQLSQGNLIVIYTDGSHQLIASTFKTRRAQIEDMKAKWQAFQYDPNIKAVIWSAQSTDELDDFIYWLIKKTPRSKLDDLLKMKDLPSFLLDNFSKYFVKYEFYGNKDYTFKS